MFIDTRGRTKIAIGICGRCSCKFPYDELMSDPNYPGLYVCKDDLDNLDPWRLPAAPTENITLDHPRPDVQLYPGPIDIPIPTIQAVLTGTDGLPILSGGPGSPPIAVGPPVNQIVPSNPWTPNTAYGQNAVVTPGNPVGMTAAGQQFFRFVCIVPGKSGAEPPSWTTEEGTNVYDGTMIWFNEGLYLLDQATPNNGN